MSCPNIILDKNLENLQLTGTNAYHTLVHWGIVSTS